jgi:hypothetical protein
MSDIKASYTEKYYEPFTKELLQLGVQYQKVIGKILNYKAYDLDQAIWKQASKSPIIQSYFANAGIQGDYSTVTFLHYYLRTLDKKKLRKEHTDLFKFLDYLENLDLEE